MSILFQPVNIKGMKLSNRTMRSATFDSMGATDGTVTRAQEDLLAGLARGGVGLVVTGIAAVDPDGRISPHENLAHGDEMVPSLARLAQAVHREGGTVALQIHHAGLEARHFLKGSRMALGPCDPPAGSEAPYRALTEGEIWGLVEAFALAARRTREAGFDAVQIHGAHAYLLSQFLSPLVNRREDMWGGDLAGRVRFHTEILAAVRREVGPDYPVMMKLGVVDNPAGGLSLEEGLEAAHSAVRAGCDCLEVSCGIRGQTYQETEFRRKVDRPGGQAFFRDWAREVKAALEVPVVMQGGLREPDLCEEILEAGEADLLAFSRPLIREPGLIRRWREGDRSRATCISCNLCLETIRGKQPLVCGVEERAKKEA